MLKDINSSYYKIISHILITLSTSLFIGCGSLETAYGTALAKTSLAISPVPMDRKFRSSFQPYVGENGEHRFVGRNMFFDGEDPKVNNAYYSKWLKEWFAEYNYCTNGYDIISNKTERFAGGDINANLGGNVVTHGRCKISNQ